ncbi:hypothetical protein [Cytobacillus oceanisediminis]|uniref:hypothetical protein n=1 Tax=Cytobacillus oceanisediminis TaxID=665099 RepID=UPI001F557368|nr:hypothetical protein [Cytobacillus oceanisediminis]
MEWRNRVCILKCGLTLLDHFAILAKGIWKMPLNRLTIRLKSRIDASSWTQQLNGI